MSCALLPLRHLWPPLALFGVLPGLAGGLGWPPALVTLHALGRRSRGWPQVAPWLVLPVVAAVAPVFATRDLHWQQKVPTIGFVTGNAVTAVTLGLLVGTRARMVESLAELDRAREFAVTARAVTARAEGRARIGCEIHDAAGHHITLIAGGAAALAASTREDDTRAAADQLRTLAGRSPGMVRSALGLTGGPMPAPRTGRRGGRGRTRRGVAHGGAGCRSCSTTGARPVSARSSDAPRTASCKSRSPTPRGTPPGPPSRWPATWVPWFDVRSMFPVEPVAAVHGVPG